MTAGAGMTRLRGWLPALAALFAFGVYAATLYPGLVSRGDSPKFQFVGRIWGTPHNPGYPLYVVVSHYFSYLPIGTLAYRINLMSAVFAALAVCLVGRIVLRLTGSGLAAAAAALVLAFGPVFWSQATIAEVYTLAAALLAAAWLCLLVWAESRRPRDLLLAVAVVALAAGNHLTIVMICPALALFVLVTDWRAPLAPRTAAAIAAIVAAGVAQYGLIVVWTLRGSAYLESAATNARQLFDVMRGAQFTSRLFNAGWRELTVERAPALFGLLVREMGAWALVLAAVGLVVLARRTPAVAALLAVASASVWLFVLNYDIADPEVFLIPVFMALAIASGVGMAAVLARLGRGGPRAAAIGMLAAAVLPAAQLSAHYRASDHHSRTFEMRLYDAMLRELPDRSAVVPGTFATELMLTYKLEGERAAGARLVRRLPRDAPAIVRRHVDDGFAVFVTSDARDELARSGFVFAPVPLWDEPLPQYLATLPRGTVVAIAGSGLGAVLPPHRGAAFPELGAAQNLFGRPRSTYAVVGVVGDRTGAREALDAGAAGLTVAPGQPIGSRTAGLPVRLELGGEQGGEIRVNGTALVSEPAGSVIAVFAPDGRIVRQARLEPARGLRLSFEGESHLLRVTSIRDCLDVGNRGWVDVSRLAIGGRLAIRVDNYRPFDSTVTMVIGAPAAIQPKLASSQGPATPIVTVQPLAAAALEAAVRPLAGMLARQEPFVYSVEIRLNDRGEYHLLGIDLGGPPGFAFVNAVVDLNNPRRATLCGGDSM